MEATWYYVALPGQSARARPPGGARERPTPTQPPPPGEPTPYVLERLARARPDLHAQVCAGTLSWQAAMYVVRTGGISRHGPAGPPRSASRDWRGVGGG
jgi:hypothetical protein